MKKVIAYFENTRVNAVIDLVDDKDENEALFSWDKYYTNKGVNFISLYTLDATDEEYLSINRRSISLYQELFCDLNKDQKLDLAETILESVTV